MECTIHAKQQQKSSRRVKPNTIIYRSIITVDNDRINQERKKYMSPPAATYIRPGAGHIHIYIYMYIYYIYIYIYYIYIYIYYIYIYICILNAGTGSCVHEPIHHIFRSFVGQHRKMGCCPPEFNWSFTSMQMIYTHTYTRPTAAGQITWQWRWNERESEMKIT